MISLFETLEETLQNHNKNLSDIEWVGSKDLEIPLENFIELAKKTDDSYSKMIPPFDLMVVGKDFVITREISDHEDNEFWLYINTKKPKNIKQLETLDSDELNKDEIKKAFFDSRNTEEIDNLCFYDQKPINKNKDLYYINFTKLWMLEYKEESSI